MTLSIIVVNWKSRDYLRACIQSIVATVRQVPYEIVVIDAGSFDGCDEMLRESYPGVRFIQTATNVGFARANNLAFEQSAGEYLLFLNPDTVVGEGAVDSMVAALAGLPDAGLVGARLLNPDGTVQTSCVQAFPTILNQALDSEFLRRAWPQSRLWGMSALFDSGKAACVVEAVSGACVMVRRSVFQQAGGFSEDYFMYAEDIDLASAVTREGYRNYYIPAATVIHYGGQSSRQAANVFAAVMIPESIRRFLRKTRGPAYSVGYRGTMLAAALARLSILGMARVVGRGGPSVTASVQKWGAVLRWTLNRDGIVRQYYTNDAVRPSRGPVVSGSL